MFGQYHKFILATTDSFITCIQSKVFVSVCVCQCFQVQSLPSNKAQSHQQNQAVSVHLFALSNCINCTYINRAHVHKHILHTYLSYVSLYIDSHSSTILHAYAHAHNKLEHICRELHSAHYIVIGWSHFFAPCCTKSVDNTDTFVYFLFLFCMILNRQHEK